MEARKKQVSFEELRETAKRLRLQARTLEGISKAMERDQTQEITVDGRGNLRRGLNFVDNFIEKTQRAAREADDS